MDYTYLLYHLMLLVNLGIATFAFNEVLSLDQRCENVMGLASFLTFESHLVLIHGRYW